MALNDRFKALWSEQARGFLLAVLLLISVVAAIFICVTNQKCLVYKRRRCSLEELLGFYGSACSGGQPVIVRQPPDTFGMGWRYAIAFCALIALVTVLALTAFSR